MSPQHLLGGRLRTSTVVLSVLFLALLGLYIVVRPDPTAPARRTSSVVQHETPPSPSPRPSPTSPKPTASVAPSPSRSASSVASPSPIPTAAVSPSLPALPSADATP